MDEEVAMKMLNRAIELEKDKRLTEALVCYQESFDLFLKLLKLCSNEAKRNIYRDYLTDYMTKAERIKLEINARKEAEKYHEQVLIKENSIGNGYDRIIGRFIDQSCVWVKIQDPYIRLEFQIFNFLRFCELVYKRSDYQIKAIELLTSLNEENPLQQKQNLSIIQKSLKELNVDLIITYSETIHDREICFANGWVIKIGRGLDYFKPLSKFHLGFCDYDLRHCHETTVNIYNKKSIVNKEMNVS